MNLDDEASTQHKSVQESHRISTNHSVPIPTQNVHSPWPHKNRDAKKGILEGRTCANHHDHWYAASKMISLVDSLCTNLIHAPLPQHRALRSAEHMLSAGRRRAFPRIHLSANGLTFIHSRCADCLGVSKNQKLGYPDFTVLLGNIDMTFMT